MSAADLVGSLVTSANWLRSWQSRCGFTIAAVIAAAALRFGLHAAIGLSHSFVLFYPAILITALMAGFWSGLLATLLSAITAALFPMDLRDTVPIHRASDGLGLGLCILVGLAISWLADSNRRRTARLQEFQEVTEGLDEMVVIVDRDYRYRVANRAFLNYCGMKKEDVIGRPVSEVGSPCMFEAAGKKKLDECFQGKVVRHELRYKHPQRGERAVLITHFPIAGTVGVERAACILEDVSDEKEANRSLKLFRMLVDHCNDAVEVLDPDTLRFLDVNEKACADLGYTREELLEMTVSDIDPSVDEARRRDVFQAVQESGFAVLETVHRRKDGSTFPVEVSLRAVKSDRSYTIAISRDISERKKSEAALRESEDRYRDLVEHSEDLVCTHDLEGRLLSVNPAPARILGYETEELLKIPMREFVAPEFQQQFDTYLERIKSIGADKGLLCVLTKSGERRIWEYSNTLRTEGVAAPIVRGMAHDVTERKRAERALHSSEQRYRMLFEKTVAGVAIISWEGRIIDCNDAWARMFGCANAKESRGAMVTDFYVDPRKRELLLGELRQTGIVRNRELQLRREDGTLFWMLHSSTLLGGAGEERLIQSTAVDISESKRIEEALRLREEDYRRFVAQSSEGIFRQDLDAPIPIDLPEDELVQRILHDSYLAECNEAIAKMYGISAKDFIGKRLIETVDPNDPRNIELTREYIRGGFRVLERESHESDIHGNPKIFRNSMIGIVENGMLLRTWGIQRDVTEQVKTEEARAKAESDLRELVANVDGIVWEANPETFEFTFVNQQAERILGYRLAEWFQPGFWVDHLHPDDRTWAVEFCKQATQEKRKHDFEYRMVAADGRTVWLRDIVSVVTGPDGAVRLRGIMVDITQQKRSEDIVRQSEERFRVALKDSPIGIFQQDRNLRYTWVYNPMLHRPEDVLGKTSAEILGAEAAAPLQAIERRVLETGVGERTEVCVTHEGKRHYAEVTLEPLRDATGTIVGLTGAVMNVARLRELADRLEEQRDALVREKSYLEDEIQTELGFEQIVGQSATLREVLKKARVVAPTDSTVLLLGETGTGKELVARSIHALSGRSKKTFIKLNCAAVPSGLLESELFGHEKGAFTGAVNQKVGRIELADKGTLFLDEIGELPPELQPKLLRVLQDREFERLGGVHTLHADVRIISATNRDLRQDVVNKNFREDLYYRLNVFPIELPPLRERSGDIPLLVHHFVRKHAARAGKHIESVPRDTMQVLQKWSWPGNIRELENMIERMVIMSKGPELAAPPTELQISDSPGEDNLTEMEREHIIRVLRETQGVLSGTDGAASRLGIKRTTLQSMLKRFGIEVQDFRRRSGTFGEE